MTSAVLSADREAFDALQGIADYAPANQEYKTESIKAKRDRMDNLLRAAVQAEAAAVAAREAANASQWDFHDAMLGAKVQVEAQYGSDSNEFAALGMKKKSDYKRPTRSRQSSRPTS
jgi:hypothetical protein